MKYIVLQGNLLLSKPDQHKHCIIQAQRPNLAFQLYIVSILLKVHVWYKQGCERADLMACTCLQYMCEKEYENSPRN